MGRKPRTNAASSPVDDSQDSPLLSLFDSMGQDSRVMIWRWDGSKAKSVYLYTLGRDEATEQRLQELTGGGKYTCREQKRDPETGKYVWGQSRTIEIGGPARNLTQILPTPGDSTQPGGVAGPGGTTVAPATMDGSGAALNAAMVGTVVDLLKASKELRTPVMPATDPLASLKPVLEMQGRMLELMMTMIMQSGKKGGDDISPLEMIREITTMVRANTSPANSLKEQLEMMNEVLDLKDRAAPANDDSLMGVISTHLGKLLDVIKEHQKSGQPRRARQPVPQPAGVSSGAAPAPAIPATTSGEQVALLPWQQAIQPFRKQLIGLAQRGKNAENTARFIYMVAPDTAKAVFREFVISAENPASDILHFIPELQPFQSWVQEFVEVIADEMGLLTEEGDEPDVSPEGGEISEDAVSDGAAES